MNWNKVLMYLCFIYSGISFEFVYIQLLPLFNNSGNYALPPPPFVYDPVYKTTPSYIWYIVLVSFLGSAVSLLAGIALYNVARKRQAEAISADWIENITDGKDKMVIAILKENNGSMTQAQLVKESGMSKVKVHRIVHKLEQSKVIEKTRYGQTNKIHLQSYK